jgi:hypothetical protein
VSTSPGGTGSTGGKSSRAGSEGGGKRSQRAATRTASSGPDPGPAREPEPPQAAQTGDAEPEAPLEVVFDRLRGFAHQQNRGLFASLDGGRLLERSASRLRIEVCGGFNAKRLNDRKEELTRVCADFFGHPMLVEVVADESAAKSASDSASQREEIRKRRQEALNHPAVNVAIQTLEAEIVEIRPLGGRR